MDQEPDAVEQALAELASYGLPDDRYDYYAGWIRTAAAIGEPGNQWQASHLCAMARGYGRRDEKPRERG